MKRLVKVSDFGVLPIRRERVLDESRFVPKLRKSHCRAR